MTIEDIIRTANQKLRDICAAPVPLHEQVRFELAQTAQMLGSCLNAIERDRQAEAEAKAKAEAAAAEAAAAENGEEEEPAEESAEEE